MVRKRLCDHSRLDFRRSLGFPLFGERNAGNRALDHTGKTKNNNNVAEVCWFFLAFSLIRVLPNASKIDFNSSLFHVDLWAVLQEPLSMTLRFHTHIATLGNAHWPTVLLNFSMISILTLKSTLLLLLCGHPVSSPPVSVNYVIIICFFIIICQYRNPSKRGSVMLKLPLFYLL